jgi:hypothetical protein
MFRLMIFMGMWTQAVLGLYIAAVLQTYQVFI